MPQFHGSSAVSPRCRTLVLVGPKYVTGLTTSSLGVSGAATVPVDGPRSSADYVSIHIQIHKAGKRRDLNESKKNSDDLLLDYYII
jgi:hypothetical protein